MSHELSIREDGTVEAAFAGKVPWHGLGKMVLDRMTPHEGLTYANLLWKVKVVELFYHEEHDFREVRIPDTRAIIREDNGEYFGTVGPRFTPVQNEEQAEFLTALVGEGGTVECVGALFDGRKIFWTVKCPNELIIGGEDKIDKYIILVNGHDGSLAFTCFWSPVRVVCNNTLRAAIRGSSNEQSVRFRHTTNVQNKVDEARKILSIADQYYIDLASQFEKMIDFKISDEFFTGYTMKLFDDKEDTRNIVASNYRGERQTGTLWGAYNAVTQYADHQMRFRGKENREDKRFESVVYGPGHKLKQRAFDLCMTAIRS